MADDFYCREVLTGKLNVQVIFETDLIMAFYHTQPYFEEHIVIIPKTHIDSLASYEGSEEMNRDFFEAIKFVTKKLKDEFGGCRISSNVGDYQTSKHLHWYVHFGKRLRTENGDPIM